MAFVNNDSYNIISRRISNVGISFTHTDTQTVIGHGIMAGNIAG
jgi:hypothetical protein